MPIMTALAYTFLGEHEDRIAEMLGGEATAITIVPSKRGKDYETQPLRRALSLRRPPDERLRHALVFSGNPEADYRHRFAPEAFTPGPEFPVGERVVLIEDLWVTGATAMSAAGALLENGSASVVIIPLARLIDVQYWPEDHPYRTAMQRPYDLDWSR
jgi:hypothetical protein